MHGNVGRGPEFAKWLVDNLTDLEFELLVRDRVRREFARIESMYPNLSSAHHSCRYAHSFTDESEWRVDVGENYRNCASQQGQVLSVTVRQAGKIMDMRVENNISLLLPAPEKWTAESEEF